METTGGHLLGGRLRYAQPKEGYRTGIEPVLLAASVPAAPGQHVLEAGTGAGAGLMCLAARVPGITGLGIEVDPAMADLARHNIAANRLAGIDIRTGDILDGVPGAFDHAFANPPWHGARSTASPCPGRRLAKQGEQGLIPAWILALTSALRVGGTLTLILPDALTPQTGAAMRAAGLANVRRTPLLPKPGRPPKLALLTSRKPGPHQLSPGDEGDESEPAIILHEPGGAYTQQIEAVLREGAALEP